MQRRKTTKTIKIVIITIFVFILLSLAIYESQKLRAGPEIVISYPADGIMVDKSLIEIKGIAKNISFISMNGAQIFTDEQGNFNEKLLLSYGYNIISFNATDRFGREILKKINIIYK